MNVGFEFPMQCTALRSIGSIWYSALKLSSYSPVLRNRRGMVVVGGGKDLKLNSRGVAINGGLAECHSNAYF